MAPQRESKLLMMILTSSRDAVACVSRVADAVAAYDDASTVWVHLLGAYFTYNRSVGNLLPAVLGDDLVVYDVEGIGDVESFPITIHAGSDALAEAAHLLEYD